MGLFSNNIQYTGGFIEQEDGPVMIAMLDGTGMNAAEVTLLPQTEDADEAKE